MTLQDALHDESAALAGLAARAGIAVDWTDARGRPQRVTDDVLRTILQALEFPCASAAQVRESRAQLEDERSDHDGFFVVDCGAPIELPGTDAQSFELRAEDGSVRAVTAYAGEAGRARLPPIDVPGYYRLQAGSREWAVAVAPARCPGMSELMAQPAPRAWGIAAQLYSLRRTHDGVPARAAGLGDFTALAQLAGVAAAQGADALAISPVHAMFAADPARYSPYAPSSRLFLNSLYADPAALLGEPAVAAALHELGLGDEALRLDGLPLIDWPAVARLRMKLLRRMYDDFRGDQANGSHAAFQAFRLAGGEALESHARFEALHARHLPPLGAATDWRYWPSDLRDSAGAGVRAYARSHDKDVGFHVFLQWLAAHGLQRAQRSARDAGMAVGLIGDLAVGTDPGGSHAWSRQADILEGLSPGAPPDIYNPLGQRWGLTAFSPRALRLGGYGAFIEMLRATLAYCGGVRVDHVLGLARMWLVPEGASAKDGAYLQYPLQDMLRLIALEAWRHRALIIGENLGTVPEGFNERIANAGMLGMNVLWFQRESWGHPAAFQPPRQWPENAVSMTTTHDLPTVAGWWKGNDINWRARLQLLAPDETEQGLQELRALERGALWHALRESHSVVHDAPIAPPDQAPVAPVLRHVAGSSAPLVLVPAEDLLGLAEQPNIPGTIDTHPNWQRRFDVDAGQFFENDDVRHRVDAVTQGRRSL